MRTHHFWLTPALFAKIKPHQPTDAHGVPRVDGRRVISGLLSEFDEGLYRQSYGWLL